MLFLLVVPLDLALALAGCSIRIRMGISTCRKPHDDSYQVGCKLVCTPAHFACIQAYIFVLCTAVSCWLAIYKKPILLCCRFRA